MSKRSTLSVGAHRAPSCVSSPPTTTTGRRTRTQRWSNRWVRARGYRYRLIGENLALGYRSSQSVVNGWMNSPGHRENILTSGFDEVGIALVNDSPRRGYRGPLVVALYGRR
jgi:uncharacterized protein YkwD